ncbi:H-NS histone family protein [uncultured Tateyamaria sp.]|uniref:H-NS histone family protein n=1 Tax=uncultured Tateyamaria sp. TaxID=455651 RepID=UPI0026071273|nr:H-NS histone family protein [uncultured Tateyamaria sp.]
MAAIDIETLDLPALHKHRKDVDKAIEKLTIENRTLALSAAKDAAAEYGYSLDELTGGQPGSTKKRRIVKARYRNPDNHKQVWSGQGRKPNWLKAGLEAGRDPEDFLI